MILRFHDGRLQALSSVSLLEELAEYNVQLERIHQCLEEYLEAKRQAFPRFYFLSNDDLLELLSHTRDPIAQQPYLKKLFEGDLPCVQAMALVLLFPAFWLLDNVSCAFERGRPNSCFLNIDASSISP